MRQFVVRSTPKTPQTFQREGLVHIQTAPSYSLEQVAFKLIAICEMEHLDVYERAVYLYLASLSTHFNEGWKVLGSRTGMSGTKACHCVGTLKEKGLVESEAPSGNEKCYSIRVSMKARRILDRMLA